ncbi:flagellar basal body-associated FliL family protein [Pseudomonas sp. GX19020]|uniref:flagellar basal body-associated FliL family protein n=1 Tax=Pseudomonas sp. GX19020 TaxID=2942277 RepID=UPI0020187EC0|nr:flagellar basal body-associated FliL family protein [Pseudomonas sp. GX19020]MCL4066026.1 flagellar basal body-associated FliL family protein [Pseudomonas sp. GX19020]
MKKLLVPLLLSLIGFALGGGAGYFLRVTPAGDLAQEGSDRKASETPDPAKVEFVRLNNQFIVPVMEGGRIVSLIAASLSLEIVAGQSDMVFAREPKLQDAFLQVMFDHANSGGFRGSFTDSSNLIVLRKALLEQARTVLGPTVNDVLITEIARQDS